MPNCPVCGNKLNSNMLCTACSFDDSTNAERYPAFAPAENKISVAGLRAKREEKLIIAPLQAQIAELTRENEVLRQQYAARMDEKGDLGQQLAKMSEDYLTLQQKNSLYAGENETLQKQVKKLHEDKEQLSERINKLKEKNNKLNEKLTGLKKEMATLQAQVTNLEKNQKTGIYASWSTGSKVMWVILNIYTLGIPAILYAISCKNKEKKKLQQK